MNWTNSLEIFTTCLLTEVNILYRDDEVTKQGDWSQSYTSGWCILDCLSSRASTSFATILNET